MKIKHRLQKLRKMKKMTQQEVAVKIGVTVSALSNYEQGIRVPRDEVKKKIAKFYGVSIETLFY